MIFDDTKPIKVKIEGATVKERCHYLSDRLDQGYSVLERRQVQLLGRGCDEDLISNDFVYLRLLKYCERASIMLESLWEELDEVNQKGREARAALAADWIAGEKTLIRANK